MSAGLKHQKIDYLFHSHHELPHVGGPLVKEILKEIKFSVPYIPKFKLNVGQYDIPYLCGYSKSDGMVYFDRDFEPDSYNEPFNEERFEEYNGEFSFPTVVTLMTHEEIEKLLEDVDHPQVHDYEQRHHIATHAESLMVDYFEYSWQRYTLWTTRSWHAAYAKWKGRAATLSLPPDLDLSPYDDEHDEILTKMNAAMRRRSK